MAVGINNDLVHGAESVTYSLYFLRVSVRTKGRERARANIFLLTTDRPFSMIRI